MSRIESINLQIAEFGTEEVWRQSWRGAICFSLLERQFMSEILRRRIGVGLGELSGNALKDYIRRAGENRFGTTSRRGYFALQRARLNKIQGRET